MTQPLWTYDTLQKATRGRRLGAAPDAVTGISIDTRTLVPGDAFFAIKGDVHDGHNFATMALARGASTAVIAESRLSGLARAKGCLTIVDDVLDALRALGIAARARSEAGIVAVTGSVGKTGTKEALRNCLSRLAPTHAAEKSFNNHWGVPLTLARMPRDTERAVFEIGMNHADEITPLSRFVQPDVVAITTVGPVHIENFPDGEAGVAKAKAEIFDGLKPGGVAVLNADNPWFDLLRAAAEKAGARVRSFGAAEGADARLTGFEAAVGHAMVHAVVDGAPDGRQAAAPGLGELRLLEQQLGIQRHGRDGVVDVVRNAAGHLAQRAQALGLQHGLLALAQVVVGTLQGAVELRLV